MEDRITRLMQTTMEKAHHEELRAFEIEGLRDRQLIELAEPEEICLGLLAQLTGFIM